MTIPEPYPQFLAMLEQAIDAAVHLRLDKTADALVEALEMARSEQYDAAPDVRIDFKITVREQRR